MILSQLRWIDHLVHAQKLTKQLLDILEVCPNMDLQKEIVSAIPEIIDDTGHEVATIPACK
jgi:hypothetical protein